MANGIINGTPIQEGHKMHVHATTKKTQIYVVDICAEGIHTAYEDEITDIAQQFVELYESNEFIKGVVNLNGLVQSIYPVSKQLEIFKINNDFRITPVTTPNLILVFGIHTERCVLDHAEILKQRFPHAQILILNDLCASSPGNRLDILFTYCLRSKRIDFVDSSKMIIINEDTPT